MASASTTNINLPLIQPTDFPTWLGDFNSAMNTLDEVIYALQTPTEGYQEKLVSGQNIQTLGGNNILQAGNLAFKTVAGQSIFGEGDIPINIDTSNLQPKLVSGVNISPINNQSLLDGNNIEVQVPLIAGVNIKKINNQSLLGAGNINITSPDITSIPALIAKNTSTTTVTRGTLATLLLTGQSLPVGTYLITFSGAMTATKASSSSLFEVKLTYAISPNASTSVSGYTQAIDIWGAGDTEFADSNVPVPFTYTTFFESTNNANQPFMQVGYQAAAGATNLSVTKASIVAIPLS